MNIGIVGTGLMGSQIALRLAHEGHKVTVFNRDKSKAEKLRSASSSITLDVANQPSDIGSNCDIALVGMVKRRLKPRDSLAAVEQMNNQTKSDF
jgi:3-hydroxyisobutyrate dehydrogenase-like beta-hydroxyacid dehydrogenase